MRYISTLNLIELIVSRSDRDALNELLSNRRLFPINKRRLLLPEFLWLLKERLHNRHRSDSHVDDLADFAYDLTLKRFSNLPESKDINNGEESDQEMEPKQVDCRNYYRAVLSDFDGWKKLNPNCSAIEEEIAIESSCKKLVLKHFKFSWQEYMRNRRPFSVRYNWKKCGKCYSLWYPVGLGIKAFKAWLENEVPNEVEDIAVVGAHLQSKIDAQFFNKPELPIEEYGVVAPSPGHTNITDTLKISELANIVTLEKIEHFDRLRPAIRKLGKPVLRQLIIRIFNDLSDEVFEDQVIANDFGIAKATFSRFAGSKWKDRLQNSQDSSIPDLWHNAARVLGSSQAWLEIAEEAGVMRAVKDVLRKNNNEVIDE